MPQQFRNLGYNYLLYKSLLFYYLLYKKAPGRVVLCIAPCILVLTLFHFLLYYYLLYKGYYKILLAGLYYCIVPYVVLPQPLSSLLYNNLLLIKSSWQGLLLYSVLLYSALSTLLLAGLYYFYSWQGYIKIPC